MDAETRASRENSSSEEEGDDLLRETVVEESDDKYDGLIDEERGHEEDGRREEAEERDHNQMTNNEHINPATKRIYHNNEDAQDKEADWSDEDTPTQDRHVHISTDLPRRSTTPPTQDRHVHISTDLPRRSTTPTPTHKPEHRDDRDDRDTLLRTSPDKGHRSSDRSVSAVSDFRSTTTPSPTKTFDTLSREDGISQADEDDSDVDQEKVVRKRKRKKKKLDSGKDSERHREQAERHMKVREDMIKLRNHYYSKYMIALEGKVEQQREDIQRRTEQWNQREIETKEKEHQQRIDSKPRRFRSQVTTDVDYLKNISKSETYEIVAMHDKLQRKGQLETREQIDHFWGEVMMGPKWAPYFRKSGQRTSRSISAQGGDSPGGNRVKFDNKLPTVSSRISSRRKSISKAQSTLDALFPHTEFPHLKVYEMELKDDVQDPRLVAMKHKRLEFTKQQKVEKRRLLSMYERSFTNHAATTRILSHHTDMDVIRTGSNIGDLMSAVTADNNIKQLLPVSRRGISHHSTHRYTEGDTQGDTQRYDKHTEYTEDNDMTKPRKKSGKSDRSQKSTSTSITTTDSERLCNIRPLTMNSILPHCHIKEATCASTVWINYAKFKQSDHQTPPTTPVMLPSN